MIFSVEVTDAEYTKLIALGREMNGRTPSQVARGILGVYLKGVGARPGRKRSDNSCRAAMALAYRLWKDRNKTFTFESLATAFEDRWPVHAIRSRLSTMRDAGELNYRKRPGAVVFEFTDVA